MKNYSLEILRQEHDIILQAENVIDAISNLWKTAPDTYKETVEKLIAFFREYSDKYHHHKEEQLLFPEILENPDFIHSDMIEELEEHHDMFRDTLAQVVESLEVTDYAKTQELLEKYIRHLSDHIAIENNELFSLVEDLLSQADLEKLHYRLIDIDQELGITSKQDLEREISRLPDSLSTVNKEV